VAALWGAFSIDSKTRGDGAFHFIDQYGKQQAALTTGGSGAQKVIAPAPGVFVSKFDSTHGVTSCKAAFSLLVSGDGDAAGTDVLLPQTMPCCAVGGRLWAAICDKQGGTAIYRAPHVRERGLSQRCRFRNSRRRVANSTRLPQGYNA